MTSQGAPATLWWGECDIGDCKWNGNAYEDQAQANEELADHMRGVHVPKGETGGGVLVSSNDPT